MNEKFNVNTLLLTIGIGLSGWILVEQNAQGKAQATYSARQSAQEIALVDLRARTQANELALQDLRVQFARMRIP